MSRPKELNFFIGERRWREGVDWYRRHFDPTRPVRGESSPNYTAHQFWSDVPARMASLVPGVRLIYLVRDPVERIASHWIHNWAVRREHLDPADAVRRRSTYLARSLYMDQLDRYLEHFPADRILVLEQNDLRDRRIETLERVFRFLDVDPNFRHPAFCAEVHVTRAKHRISAVGASLEQAIRRSPVARVVPQGAIAHLDALAPRRKIKIPDIRNAIPAESLERLRADAGRLRAFTGLSLEHWTV
jgi:Sulfotransferase domain